MNKRQAIILILAARQFTPPEKSKVHLMKKKVFVICQVHTVPYTGERPHNDREITPYSSTDCFTAGTGQWPLLTGVVAV